MTSSSPSSRVSDNTPSMYYADSVFEQLQQAVQPGSTGAHARGTTVALQPARGELLGTGTVTALNCRWRSNSLGGTAATLSTPAALSGRPARTCPTSSPPRLWTSSSPQREHPWRHLLHPRSYPRPKAGGGGGLRDRWWRSLPHRGSRLHRSGEQRLAEPSEHRHRGGRRPTSGTATRSTASMPKRCSDWSTAPATSAR